MYLKSPFASSRVMGLIVCYTSVTKDDKLRVLIIPQSLKYDKFGVHFIAKSSKHDKLGAYL